MPEPSAPDPSTPEPYGVPGRPVRASPFVFGLTAAAGALLAFGAFLAVRRVGTVASMLLLATCLAIGLDRPVSALVRRGMRRAFAVAAVMGFPALLFCTGVVVVVPPLAKQLNAGRRVPYPLLMALVIAFLDLIPQIGATIGSIVVTLVALTVSLPMAAATLAFFCVYQGLENWIVYASMQLIVREVVFPRQDQR